MYKAISQPYDLRHPDMCHVASSMDVYEAEDPKSARTTDDLKRIDIFDGHILTPWTYCRRDSWVKDTSVTTAGP